MTSVETIGCCLFLQDRVSVHWLCFFLSWQESTHSNLNMFYFCFHLSTCVFNFYVFFLSSQDIDDRNVEQVLTNSSSENVVVSDNNDGVSVLNISFNSLRSLSQVINFQNRFSTPIFSSLISIDVRHNKLQSFEGIETLSSLQRFMGCFNPNVKSITPLSR